MEKFIHNTIAFITISMSWIMVTTMAVAVGVLVFYATYITLDLPDYSFIVYSLFGCFAITKATIGCIKAFKNSKLWYNDHIKE